MPITLHLRESPLLHPEQWRNAMDISYSDLTIGIATAVTVAAGIGPEALAAALTALGTMVGGPAGTIAGILVSAVGAAYLANLALQITRAVATGKGICLTIAIPPGVSVQ